MCCLARLLSVVPKLTTQKKKLLCTLYAGAHASKEQRRCAWGNIHSSDRRRRQQPEGTKFGEYRLTVKSKEELWLCMLL